MFSHKVLFVIKIFEILTILCLPVGNGVLAPGCGDAWCCQKAYDCEENRVVYMNREFPDAPANYKETKTESWKECQELCKVLEACKWFTWHNKKKPKKTCYLFSTYSEKMKGSAVSGPKECPKDPAGK